jgi:hypothetical protein
MKPAPSKQKSRREYQMHGLYIMKKALMRLGSKAIDRRYSVGKALSKWRADLIEDLGGDVSTQQGALVDLCVKSKLILDSIDAWLLIQPSLVNARKKSLLPVVRERQALADGLARYLQTLGLERRVKTKSLDEILEEETS